MVQSSGVRGGGRKSGQNPWTTGQNLWKCS